MGKPKAPEPPDPRETSAASTSTNVGTAVANANMGNVNQITPDGNLTYDQSGSYTWNDPYTGQSYNIPKFTATQTLSPSGTALKKQTDAANLNMATLARDQSGRLNNILSKPFDPNSVKAPSLTTDFSADRQKVEDALMARLNPQLQRDEEALRTRLSNQGIKLGSTAFDRGIDEQTRAGNDARLGAILSAGQEQSRLTTMNNQTRAQAMQEAFAGRNQPINEITALLSGSQVSQPNFVNANMPTIPTTDVGGLINTNFDQKMGIYQQKAAQSQNLLGGLFGLGGKLIGLSDDDAKKEKEPVIDLAEGVRLWKFKYKGEAASAKPRIGLMASEVEKVAPEAVSRRPDGYRQVDYGKALGSIFGVREAA
jgi:hypothetical protein